MFTVDYPCRKQQTKQRVIVRAAASATQQNRNDGGDSDIKVTDIVATAQEERSRPHTTTLTGREREPLIKPTRASRG
eukprot:scaffold17146_cov50-Attheya_sp.AAC.4